MKYELESKAVEDLFPSTKCTHGEFLSKRFVTHKASQISIYEVALVWTVVVLLVGIT